MERIMSAFIPSDFPSSPLYAAARLALHAKRETVIATARAGGSPIRVIAADIEQHLGDRLSNSLAGRLIREWLGPSFEVHGRLRWPREHGTESGATYRFVG